MLCLATATDNFQLAKISHAYLFNLRPNICKSWSLNVHVIPNNSDAIGK